MGSRVVKTLRSLFGSPDRAVSVIIVVFMLLIATLGPLLSTYDPTKIDMKSRFQAPSAEHHFGTDEMGRDVLSRVLSGGRISLASGIAVVLLAAAIGVPLGFLAGFYGGKLDFVIMRFTDLLLGFPALVLAIAFNAALGAGLSKGLIAAALVWWPGFTRLVRGQVLAERNLPYVEAARALGASNPRLMFRHLLPAVMGPIIIKATMDVGYAILFVASLGFLGLGAQPPMPEWGTTVAEARPYILDKWWAGFFPGMAITISVIGFNLFGDAIQPLITPILRKGSQ